MNPETRDSLKIEAGKALVYVEGCEIKLKATNDPELIDIYQAMRNAKAERIKKIEKMLELNTVCI